MKEEFIYKNDASVYPEEVTVEKDGWLVKIKLRKITKNFKYLTHHGGDAYGTINVTNSTRKISAYGNLCGVGSRSVGEFSVQGIWRSKYNEDIPSFVRKMITLARERYNHHYRFEKDRTRNPNIKTEVK